MEDTKQRALGGYLAEALDRKLIARRSVGITCKLIRKAFSNKLTPAEMRDAELRIQRAVRSLGEK